MKDKLKTSQMNDLCKHCKLYGNLTNCLNSDCWVQDSWIVGQLQDLIRTAPIYFSHHSFDGEKLAWLKKAQIITEDKND